MNYVLTFSLFLLIAVSGNSQISDSLFRTYKNEDLRIRALDLTGTLGGRNTNSGSFVGGNNFSDFLYNLNARMNFSQFTNRKKLQSDYLVGIGIGHSKNRLQYADNPLDSRFSLRLNGYNKSRYYPKSEFFYGYGFKLFYELNNSQQKDFDTPNKIEKTNRNSLNIEIPFSIGIGRKYPVHSVHKAKWIYSELNDNHLLSREVDEQDIEQMAHLMDDNDYTRFFDSRYKRIQDLSRVDSVLQSQDIIEKQNITYYSSLYDMYYYSSGSNRFRGSLLEGGLIAEYYNNQYKFTDSAISTNTNYHAATPVLFAEFQNYKPLNLHWQLDYGVRAEYGFNSLFKDNNKQFGSTDDRFSLEGIASLFYYPNTRSYMSLNLTARYGNKHTEEFFGPFVVPTNEYFNPYPYTFSYPYVYPSLLFRNPVYGFNYTEVYNFWSTRLSLTHYYYISPQLRVQSDFGLSHFSDNNPIYNTSNKLNANFSISFSYAFF